MLNTEKRNPLTKNIDKMSTLEMVNIMQNENYNAVKCLDSALESITKAVDAIFPKMQKGGRLFYIGCGTSGRLGVLDASECPPTYGVSPNLVIGIIAGGDKCLRAASENAEDISTKGVEDIAKFNLNENDSVVGISAAGGAQYVISALEYAKSKGCITVGLINNPNTLLEKTADIAIIADSGAEIVTGSTRMKAGTTQKLVLNMLSTALMIKLGYVYENLMINLKPTNIKLHDRTIRIVCEILECDRETAIDFLDKANWVIKDAIQLAKKINK